MLLSLCLHTLFESIEVNRQLATLTRVTDCKFGDSGFQGFGGRRVTAAPMQVACAKLCQKRKRNGALDSARRRRSHFSAAEIIVWSDGTTSANIGIPRTASIQLDDRAARLMGSMLRQVPACVGV